MQQRSELLRGEGEGLHFRARCSCGWSSEPVDMGSVYFAWDDHRMGRRHGEARGDDG